MFGIVRKIKIAALVTSLTFASLNAQATLTSYSSDGVDVVYSSVSNVTWAKDGNLFKTLYAANSNLINDIAAVTPAYQDSLYSMQTIDASDFRTSSGQMTWWGAQAFANYLSNISYAGSADWRLASAGNVPVEGYNPPAIDAEMGQLYYTELGKRSLLDYHLSGEAGTYGILDNNLSTITGDVGPFVNVVSSIYWANEEDIDEGGVWVFNARNGLQLSDYKRMNIQYYAWFVTSGQIASVAEPKTYTSLLVGLGLIGMVVRRNR